MRKTKRKCLKNSDKIRRLSDSLQKEFDSNVAFVIQVNCDSVFTLSEC